MKKLLILPLLVILTGCTSVNGPMMLQTGVSIGAGYALMKNPQALTDVEVGASIVCSVANGTELSPAFIADLINSRTEMSPEAAFILNGALNMYSLVYNGLETDNPEKVRPYTKAVCNGLNNATLQVPPVANLGSRTSALPTAAVDTSRNVLFPQVQFRKR